MKAESTHLAEGSFFRAQVRRANRNLLFANLVFLVALGLATTGLVWWFQSLFQRPQLIDPQQLLEVHEARAFPHRRVKISLHKAEPGGVIQKDGTTVARVLILPLGERILFVKAPVKHCGEMAIGWVIDRPAEFMNITYADEPRTLEQLVERMKKVAAGHRGFADDLAGRDADREFLRNRSLPVIVDATVSRTWDFVLSFGAGAIVLAGFGLAVRNLVCVARRSAVLDRHPISAMLRQHGDVATVAREIEAELHAADTRNIAGCTLTTSWLLDPHPFGMNLAKLDDILWLYRHETVHRKYGIPIGHDHELRMFTRRKRKLALMGKAPELERLADEITETRPWIDVGYNAEIEDLWKTNPERFVVEVGRRV